MKPIRLFQKAIALSTTAAPFIVRFDKNVPDDVEIFNQLNFYMN